MIKLDKNIVIKCSNTDEVIFVLRYLNGYEIGIDLIKTDEYYIEYFSREKHWDWVIFTFSLDENIISFSGFKNYIRKLKINNLIK